MPTTVLVKRNTLPMKMAKIRNLGSPFCRVVPWRDNSSAELLIKKAIRIRRRYIGSDLELYKSICSIEDLDYQQAHVEPIWQGSSPIYQGQNFSAQVYSEEACLDQLLL